ncbi:MAG: glycoside hydrolase family 32 protein [Lachnospiraceae bacterium]|nr:glycoside hydrolase family 32 protein [Lachnospiraceae bacterium]
MTSLEKANLYQSQNRIDKKEKPVFHLTPPVGWMNDPNGFSLYQGKIHLFYQYHPYSAVWGPMHWGHYISEDFITWEELPAALAPDMDYDADGCFSGSAIETGDGHVLIYTGVVENEKKDGEKEIVQHQCIAIGDGICYEKVKDNPVVPVSLLPEWLSGADFRDPKVWSEEDTYYMVAGCRDEQEDGQVVLFESKDMRNWSYLSILADNRGKYGKMWECPDFFALGEQYVLVVSPMNMQADGEQFHSGNHSIAMIGEYDTANHKLLEEQVISLDYGMDFYAPQTMQAEDGRRIMIAWMQSWDMDIKPDRQKWNGMMTVPRELELHNGILRQTPVKELELYRTEAVICRHTCLSGVTAIPGVRGRVLDLIVELQEGQYESFSIIFAKNDKYHTGFRYVPSKQSIEFDRTFSGLAKDVVCQRTMKIRHPELSLKLRLILDKYSVELFVNDGVQTFTSTFYTPLDAEDIVFECDGTAVADIEKYTIAL